MLERHSEEVPTGLPLDVNWPQYRTMERLGVYKILGAFKAGRLVGYNAFFVQPTLQHRSVLQAANDAVYLEADHRQGLAGARLIREAERMLRDLGVRRVVYFSHPDLNQLSTNAKVARLLKRLGYDHVESAHAKRL